MDREMASLLAAASIVVYSDDPRLPGFEVDKVSLESTQAFIFKGEQDLIIAFRGTDSVRDTKLDLRFWRKKLKGMRGTWHRGFVRALESVYWQLLSKLAFQGHDRRVWITGHSLGGALAVLFAARLAGMHKSHLIDGVVTLGAPRVASVLGARWLNALMKSRILQFENAGDQVTHVPMAFLGYMHVGHRIVFGIIQRLKSLIKRGLRTKVAHKGDRYLRNIKRWERNHGGPHGGSVY